ncbi:MAG: hypothetical protein RQ756_06630 [Flavobacteriaceae bacterium]|nr:hypothetical protein [Flavobacteriaceae bacterium]
MKTFITIKILLIFFLLGILNPIIAQTEELDENLAYHTEEFRKKHHIKEVHQYEYNLKTGDSIPKFMKYYDSNGVLIKWIDYKIESGKLTSTRYFNTFNEDSLVIRTTGYVGKLSPNNVKSVLAFDYNDEGNKTACQSTNDNGEVSSRIKYEYDELNRLAKVYNLDHHNKLVLTRHNVYDKKGNLVKVKHYTIRGTFAYAFNYKYDKDNRLTACYVRNKLYFKNTYNSKNLLTEVTYSSSSFTTINGNLSSNGIQKKYLYQYDDIGNLLEIKTLHNDNLIKQVKYFYETFEGQYTFMPAENSLLKK